VALIYPHLNIFIKEARMRVENWALLDRFLILGSEENTYRVGRWELDVEAAPAIRACLKTDGPRVVRTVLDGSARDPALFVLALAASPKFADAKTNAAALDALPRVARTGAQLRKFAAFCSNLRGWGRSLRSAIAQWYVSKPAAELARQLLESGDQAWSHRDLLRLSHPRPATPAHNALFQWVVDGKRGHLATADMLDGQLRPIYAFELAKSARTEDQIVRLVEDYRLGVEQVPPRWKSSSRVWETLLGSMSYLELVRNLGQLTAVGLVRPQSATTALVVARLLDRKRVENSKVHPIALLDAFRTYREADGFTPVPSVIDALNSAFYMAFDNVRPSGKRIYLAVDANCSMGRSRCVGMPSLSAAMASLALSMIYAKTEPLLTAGPFQGPPGIASQAIGAALNRGLRVDAFVVLTDLGKSDEAAHRYTLDRYRQSTGIATRLAVIAMAAEDCNMTDRNDPLQMSVAGFDASVPEILAQFIRGA
jgi:60 kDa SS-A/Ro ribonucleoprotein